VSAPVGPEEASEEFHLSCGPAEPCDTIGLCACKKMVGELARDYLCRRECFWPFALFNSMAALGCFAGAIHLMATLPYNPEAYAGQFAGGFILLLAAIATLMMAMSPPCQDED
jgi:hypothetical protein